MDSICWECHIICLLPTCGTSNGSIHVVYTFISLILECMQVCTYAEVSISNYREFLRVCIIMCVTNNPAVSLVWHFQCDVEEMNGCLYRAHSVKD